MSILRRPKPVDAPLLSAAIATIIQDQFAGLADQFADIANNPRQFDVEMLLIDLRSLTANTEKVMAALIREGAA